MKHLFHGQPGRFLSVILSVAMLVTALPADLLGGIAKVAAAETIAPAADEIPDYVGTTDGAEEGTYVFTGYNSLADIPEYAGITLNNWTYHSSDYGVTNQTGTSLVIKLDHKANIVIGQGYGTGASITASSGTVLKENTDNAQVFTILGAEAGELTITPSSSVSFYMTYIKIVFIAGEGEYVYTGYNSLDEVPDYAGITLNGWKYRDAQYGMTTEGLGGNPTIVIDLDHQANIEIGQGYESGATLSADSGTISKKSDGNGGSVFTVKGADAGEVTITPATQAFYLTYIKITFVEYAAEGEYVYTGYSSLDEVPDYAGITLNGWGYHSAQYGATTESMPGNPTIVINLPNDATIEIGQGYESGATLTSSSGNVSKKSDGNSGSVFTVKGAAAGEVTITPAEQSFYLTYIKITYVSYVAEGTYAFTGYENMAAIPAYVGIKLNNWAYHSSGYGVTNGSGTSIVINLERKAKVVIGQGYGTGADITASSGKVKKENSGEGQVFTILEADAGELTITPSSSVSFYMTYITVSYPTEVDGVVPAGSYSFSYMQSDLQVKSVGEPVPGFVIKNVSDVGNKHGFVTTEDTVLAMGFDKPAKVVFTTCCYGVGENATLSAANGNVSKTLIKEEGMPACLFTVTYVTGDTDFYFSAGTYIHGVKVEYADLEGDPAGDLSKLDVWDFGATGADSETENQFLTKTLVNGLYEGVTPGTTGVYVDDFTLGDLSFVDGGTTGNYWNASTEGLTRYENTAFSDTLTGYIASGAASGEKLYLELDHAKTGDMIDFFVKTDAAGSTLVIENVMEPEWQETYEITEADGVRPISYYVPVAGSYKIYAKSGVLMVGKITRYRTNEVTVSGSVEILATMTTSPVLIFKNANTDATVEATVSDGAYSVALNEEYTYIVSLKDANGFVISWDSHQFSIAKDAGGKTHNIVIEAVPVLHISGNITVDGKVDPEILTKLEPVLTPTGSDPKYTPEYDIDKETGAYDFSVENGMTYTLSFKGINDYELKDNAWGPFTQNQEEYAIAITQKPVYKVTIVPDGATLEDLTGAELTFVNLGAAGLGIAGDEDYTYTFVIGTDEIKLRDGVYSITLGDKGFFGAYHQELTSNLKVNGKDVVKLLPVSNDPVTEWNFAAADWDNSLFNAVVHKDNAIRDGIYKTLKLQGAAVNKVYCLVGDGSKIFVPVPAGSGKVVVDYCYQGSFTFDGDDTVYTTVKSAGSTSASDTAEFAYTKEEAGEVRISFSGTTYINYIKVVPTVEYQATITVNPNGNGDYKTINDALDAVRKMERTADQIVTISIVPGDYEEMLVIDVPNIKLVNAAGEKASTDLKNGGVKIAKNAVRITSYYGHGYTYYSMGDDSKWHADVLAANKQNGYASFENTGSGTKAGSYWNATVVINADNVSAEGIIFENSFNQYVSAKAAQDVIVAQSGAKEGSVPRATMKAGDTKVQEKSYVERAAAMAIYGNCDKIYFDNCKFVGRQDTLYGGSNSRVAFNKCAIYGGTDYIFGGMIAAFNQCDLVFNTYPADSRDIGYITAPQHTSGRGYVFYNCLVTSTTPGQDTISKTVSNPGYFGRPWQGETGEAVFVQTTIDVDSKGNSLICPEGWNSSLSGESALCLEYRTIEKSGEDNSAKRAAWSGGVLTTPKLADNTDISFAAFLGDWKPFGADFEMDLTDDGVHSGSEKPADPYAEGLHVELADFETEFYYTGFAIKPAINVTNNGQYLTEGVDYTVSYSNNVNASIKKKAKITVKGKGNLSGSESVEFEIKQRNIEEALVPDIAVIKNKDKAKPVVVYNGKLLREKKDYTLENPNQKFEEDSSIVISGTGNFTGTTEANVHVVEAADAQTFKVTVGKEKLTYNGDEQYPSVTVYNKKDKAKAAIDPENYEIIWPENVTDAGKIEFYVVGIAPYSGYVKCSYKINPLKTDVAVDAAGLDADGYVFDPKGVTIPEGTFSLTTGDLELVEGKDFTVTYSGNKKVGDKAKYNFKFTGNYKGSKAKGNTFKIVPASLSDFDAEGELQIGVAGKTAAKAGIYKVKPVVCANNTLLKNSDMTITYYTDEDMTAEMAGSNKAEPGSTVYMKIVGKGNYAAKDENDFVTASYKIVSADKDHDLGKAKIVDATTGKAIKATYTGKAIEPTVKVLIGKTEVPADAYEVEFINNVNKGKATVIIKATDTLENGDPNPYAGSKAATFSIANKGLKGLPDLFKDMFN